MLIMKEAGILAVSSEGKVFLLNNETMAIGSWYRRIETYITKDRTL